MIIFMDSAKGTEVTNSCPLTKYMRNLIFQYCYWKLEVNLPLKPYPDPLKRIIGCGHASGRQELTDPFLPTFRMVDLADES